MEGMSHNPVGYLPNIPSSLFQPLDRLTILYNSSGIATNDLVLPFMQPWNSADRTHIVFRVSTISTGLIALADLPAINAAGAGTQFFVPVDTN